MLIGPELAAFWAQPGDTPSLDVTNRVTDALSDQMGTWEYSLRMSGSAANGTNIPVTSDYDLIATTPSTSDNPHERREHWLDFRNSLRRALEERFNAEAIDLSLKCFNIDRSLELPPTDILPCLARTALIDGIPVKMIEFWTNERNPRQILSSPSSHIRNNREKDARTNGAAKQLVRVAKNGRGLLVASDVIGPATAPSYMIESSVMNMPDEIFTGDPLEDLRRYVAFMQRALLGPSTRIRLKSGNGLHPLIGPDELRQWDYDDAERFTREVAEIAA